MRVCSRCSINKPPEEFYRNHYSPDGLRSICVECSREDQSKLRFRTKKQKAAYDRKRWVIDKEKLSARYKKWASENKDRRYELNRNYRLRKKGQLGQVPSDIKDILRKDQLYLCYYCSSKLENDHLDHKIPLSRGGLHDTSNLCLSCPSCNLRKGTMTEEEFVGGEEPSRVNV